MALATLGGLNYSVLGGIGNTGSFQRPIALTTITQDATLESAQAIGRLMWEGGGTHTIDTTGSSKFEFRTGTATFANVGSSFAIGIADVDAAAGPAARAVNVTDTITMGVSAVKTGGGGSPTGNAWQSITPTTGSKTIAHGDFVAFCTQMVVRAGVDTIQTSFGTGIVATVLPTVTSFTGGAYATATAYPNCVVVASDGTRGYIFGGAPLTAALSTAFASNSTPNERGNLIVLPGPARVLGIVANVTVSANLDLVFYSDALGTPVARGTVSLDSNSVGSTSNAPTIEWFTPYDAAAGTYAAICKPTTTTNVTLLGLTLSNLNHQNGHPLGTNGYAVNRSSGAFAAQNSNLDRYGIGIVIDAIGDGVSDAPVGRLISAQRGAPY